MSRLHLTTGSQQPPKVDGKLRLYSMEYCPFAQRSRLVLFAKNIPHDIVNINLYNKPEWFFKIHPEGKVPALDTGSEIIVESLVISDFLDEKYPGRPLNPKDPQLKARDQELIKKHDELIRVFYKYVFDTEDKSPEYWVKEFEGPLGVYEKELAARGTTFFGGDQPGMLDYMIWPWSERKEVFPLVKSQKLPFKEGQFSLLKKWREAMKEDPACKATYNSPEKHLKLLQCLQKKTAPDYDNF